MTIDFARMESPQSDVQIPQTRAPRPDRQSAAGIVTAGAITALLSGDVRLAVRATRLLMEEGRTSPQSSTLEPRRRLRGWRRLA
jgi:hypothetical protein